MRGIERGDQHQSGKGTESATRVADVLFLFMDESETLGVTEISRRLGIHKTVVYRVLRSLASRGFVVSDAGSKKYRLGPAAAALGARALRDLDLRSAALPVLRRLQRETRETTTVSELLGSHRVYLDQVPSPQEIKMTVEVGRLFPLHAASSSLAILAFAPPDLREHVLSGPLEKLTPKTKVSREELEHTLAKIQSSGVACSFGERQPGTGSVAAPVFGIDGYSRGSLSICGPIHRFDEAAVERFAPLVREAAREVSLQLGATEAALKASAG